VSGEIPGKPITEEAMTEADDENWLAQEQRIKRLLQRNETGTAQKFTCYGCGEVKEEIPSMVLHGRETAMICKRCQETRGEDVMLDWVRRKLGLGMH
jgi:hypothetical protein